MIQAKCLESGIKSMEKVKSKKCKTGKIYDIVCRYFKKTMGDGIKIFSIAFDQTEFYKIKIKPMEYEKGKNGSACPDHETGEKGCFRFVAAHITNRACKPILDPKENSP